MCTQGSSGVYLQESMVPEGVCDYLQEEAHAFFTETGEDSIDITDPFFRDLLSDTTIEGGETIKGLGEMGGKESVQVDMALTGKKFFIGDASTVTF